MNRTMRLFSKLPYPNQWLFWVVLAVIFKSLFFFYEISHEKQSEQDAPYNKTFAVTTIETTPYLEPAENFIKVGHYDSKKWGDFRMPGYGWLYCLLRLFLPITYALNGLVLIQLLLSAISVFILARISYLIFKKENYFYMTFFLYLVSTVVSLYDYKLETESICTSSLIFSIYFLIRPKTNKTYLILAGLFITWCIFLKPVMGALLGLYALYIVSKKGRYILNILMYDWKSVIIFLIPFMIIDGAWIVRNFTMYKRFVPLTKSVYFPADEKGYLHELLIFLSSYGGSINSDEPTSGVRFFIPSSQLRVKGTVPPYIYTSQFNYDSLVMIRNLVIDVRDTTICQEIRDRKEEVAVKKLRIYSQSIRDEKPVLYYFFSRFNIFKTYLLHTGTHNLFIKSESRAGKKIEMAFKVFSSLLYILVLIFGFAGAFILMCKGAQNFDYFLVAFPALYFALLYPFAFKLDDFRYFACGYPMFLVCCTYALISIYSKIEKREYD